ncbi:DUF6169 family protein [Dyadobacter jiangsuensis]|uniref:Uncharacterized protein n=1 Tax=Dyadobacter jiangsuensis TaxID=1591085 RepID=A0A2P8FZZ4_9BACT|nr:DUF6169 family protein [Dyadobacter jiangsuensis]PSL27293.1 hypothetical protein CLV60_108149 [Dyadobacter jiangsuensis]
MHEESNLLRPYSYFHNPASGTYHFDTDHNVDFTVYFVLDSSWFPLFPELSDDIYTFGFWSSCAGRRDRRVMHTLAKIIKEHFQLNRDSILTFVCDDDDKKQMSRRRKFNGWYLLQRGTGVIKLDKDVVFDGKTKHTSILMHEDNLFFSVVSEAYLNADPDVTSKILD